MMEFGFPGFFTKGITKTEALAKGVIMLTSVSMIKKMVTQILVFHKQACFTNTLILLSIKQNNLTHKYFVQIDEQTRV